MKKAIIIGATSGIGLEVAKLLLAKGYILGVAGRRKEELQKLKESNPSHIEYEAIDVTEPESTNKISTLIEKIGGMELFFNAAGIGHQNRDLDPDIETSTAETNVIGFIRIITFAFNYFKLHGGGHIAVISSIAGTKGLGSAPAYSATKRFQNTYIEALAQLSNTEGLNIHFTDIRPGFVKTALLNDSHNYPMLMEANKVAQKIIKAIKSKKRIQVIDWRYSLLVKVWKLIPRFVWEHLPIKN